MRLVEVSDSTQDLILLFRNQIKRADSSNSFVTLSWNAISNIMTDMGHGAYNYDDFKAEYNANPSLKSIVKNFNGDGVTLKTDAEAPKEPGIDADVKPTNKVDQMAKRAAGKRL